MKKHLFLPLIFAALFITSLFLWLSYPARAELDAEGWETVADGIAYQRFDLTDPNNKVYVARMARSNPNVTLDSMLGQGRISGGTETTSGMFARYDDSLNYWGQSWGKRSDVVVAINGYYYGSPAEPPGVPWRGQIQAGWYAKRFDNLENGSGFVWKLDGQAFIGECVYHVPSQQYIRYGETSSDTIKITAINIPRDDEEPDQLILYTHQFDRDTKTGNGGVEVLVEMTRPTLILPGSFPASLDWLAPLEAWLNPAQAPHTPTAEATGIVRRIYNGQGSTPIPFDHIVLSATGIPATRLLQNLQEDMQIGISQAVTHYDKDDCTTPLAGKDWTKAYAAIGGQFHFLENGIVNGFPGNPQATVRDARTAIAFNQDYVFFIVVDQIIFGDDPGDPAPDLIIQPGMNMADLGNFALGTLGATDGIAQDGGGSSTLVINGQVKNVPNDWDADITIVPCPVPEIPDVAFLPLISKPSQTTGAQDLVPPLPLPPAQAGETCYQGTERWVANGMMMVVVSPMITSTAFTADLSVTTTVDASLRLGPGTNYRTLEILPAGSTGLIKPHFNGLDGVFATGDYWWKVKFGNLVGWLNESVLIITP